MDEAKPYVATMAALAKERGPIEREWQDITTYIVPRKGLYLDRGDKISDKRNKSKIIDPAATRANKYLAAGILGGMTSPARPWVRLSLRDDSLMDFAPVKEYFHNGTAEMLDIFGWSNLYTALYSLYKEVGAFGTGAMVEEEDLETLIRFSTFTAGEYYLTVDSAGRTNGFYRCYDMTAQNIVEKFGESGVHPEVLTASRDDSNKLKRFTLGHCIKRNTERKRGYIDNANMEYESVYWQHKKTDRLYGKYGFMEFPLFSPRWDTTSTQTVYGEGPGQDQLGNAKMLQEFNAGQIKALNQENRPAMRVPPDYNETLDMRPGAQNVDPTMKEGGPGKGISRLFDFRFDYQGISAKIEDIRTQIGEGFYNDLFRMLVDRPGAQPPTAREVAERHEEKLVMLSPVLERLQSELLNPMIKRTFNIMTRNNVLPPAPEEIQDAEMKVEYTSILSQAQKLIGLQSVDAFLGYVGLAAQIFPSVVDKIDADEMTDQYADMTGVPPKIIVPDDDVAQVRKARAADQEEEAAMEQAQAMGGTVKDLAASKVDENSALTELTNKIMPGIAGGM